MQTSFSHSRFLYYPSLPSCLVWLFSKSTWTASCFLQTNTLPGCMWMCFRHQLAVSSLSKCDLSWYRWSLSRVTCSVIIPFFFFFPGLELNGAQLTLVELREGWFYHLALAAFHQPQRWDFYLQRPMKHCRQMQTKGNGHISQVLLYILL